MMHELVDSINARPANAPGELMTLARTLKRRLPDVLAYFDHEFSSNGPTEAVNGRLEHLRGIALGFTNLNNYITRSLLHAGGFRTNHTGTNLTTMNPTHTKTGRAGKGGTGAGPRPQAEVRRGGAAVAGAVVAIGGHAVRHVHEGHVSFVKSAVNGGGGDVLLDSGVLVL